MSDFFGSIFGSGGLGGLFGSGPAAGTAGATPIWNLNNPVGTDTLGGSTLAPAGQTWGGNTGAQTLGGIGSALKGGVGGGVTQMPQGQPQPLPSAAPVHQGQGDLTSLLQMLQQRRNLLQTLGKPGAGGGAGGLLGM